MHPDQNTPPSRLPALPLGAALLMGSLTPVALAQNTADHDGSLPTVEVKASAVQDRLGKDHLRPATVNVGKGKQDLRDIPQSVTVVTEKLMDDRQIETVKEALRNTSGVTFQAGETGEEDVRLRGFSLAASGDLYLDGMRDPAFYDRDTFNLEQVEVMRGSASMLFGRGSTGGVVNQVTKQPHLMDEHEITATVGNGGKVRLTGDFNIQTGESQALRINAMGDRANNNGNGADVDRKGVALAYRYDIGEKNEFGVNLYHLQHNNGVNYGLQALNQPDANNRQVLMPVDPDTNYAMASDYNKGKATFIGAHHTYRFDNGGELTTRVRQGDFERDFRASAIRWPGPRGSLGPATVAAFNDNITLNRNPKYKIQDVTTRQLQSDYSGKFKLGDMEHSILAGVEFTDEKKTVFNPIANSNKPATRVGTPNDGAWRDEAAIPLYKSSHYRSKGFGAYLQDTVAITPEFKLIGGLRYDWLKGDYSTYATTGKPTDFSMKVSKFSHRLGALYQPSEAQSYYFSYGTSFNTSGDTYSLSQASASAPPEKSRNFELGARFDTANKQFSTRVALFHSTKYNERNTDPDNPALALMSGKRHVAGLELDFVGRITPKWEVYASYMFMPNAKVDEGTKGQSGGDTVGERPGLTPKHTGTVWTTYQILPSLRVGAGVNFRSSQTPAGSLAKYPHYATYDLMAEYRVNSKFNVKFNVNNVSNKLYAAELYRGHYFAGPGRTYSVTAAYKF